MIKSNQRFFNLILVFFDIAVVTAALLFAWYIRFVSPVFDDGVRTMDLRAYVDLLGIIIPLYLILFTAFVFFLSITSRGVATIPIISDFATPILTSPTSKEIYFLYIQYLL